MSATDVEKGSFLLGEFCEEMSSPTPQPGEIEELHFATLVLRVVINTTTVATGTLARAQTTNLIMNTHAKDSSITASVHETGGEAHS